MLDDRCRDHVALRVGQGLLFSADLESQREAHVGIYPPFSFRGTFREGQVLYKLALYVVACANWLGGVRWQTRHPKCRGI